MAKPIICGIWVLTAVIAAYGGYVGGDTAIVLGWLFLVWTAPFGIVWWFYVYPAAITFLPKVVLEFAGPALAIIAAYWFWFVLVPSVLGRARGASERRAL